MKEGVVMPKTPKQMEKIIISDGWVLIAQRGSHRHYVHPTKRGRVTIPFHTKDLDIRTEKSILRQAGLLKKEG